MRHIPVRDVKKKARFCVRCVKKIYLLRYADAIVVTLRILIAERVKIVVARAPFSVCKSLVVTRRPQKMRCGS